MSKSSIGRTRRRGGRRNTPQPKKEEPYLLVKRKADVAYKAVMKLEKNNEKKHTQRQPSANNNIDTDGYISSNLFSPADGTWDTERVGDGVALHSIDMKSVLRCGFVTVDVNPDGTAVDQNYSVGCVFRIILFVDKTNSITTIDELIGTASNEQQVITNGYNVDYKKNVVILYDQTFSVNPTASINSDHYEYKRYTHKFKNGLPVQFNAATTTVNTNAIKVAYISNVITTEDNSVKPDMLANFRFYYTDH
jgi:hypothetical protein